MSTELAKTGGNAIEVHVGSHALSDIVEKQLWKTGELQKVANVVFPVTALDTLPPMHVPSLTVLSVNPDTRTGKDVYFITSDQLGLSKHVILKMLAAAGGHVKTRKETPEHDLDHIRYTAVVWGRLPDGTMHTEQASKSWSWTKQKESSVRKALAKRDGTEEQGMKAALQYRDFADEQTETKAILRAARAFLSIRTSYTPAELQKPFVLARSVPQFDLDDPEIRRAYQMKMLDATFSAYGPESETAALPEPQFKALPPTDDEEDDETDFIEQVADDPVQAETVDAEYNPLEAEPEQVQSTEEQISAELDASILGHARQIDREDFAKILARHKIKGGLKGASVDLKSLVNDDCKAFLEGRLAI